MSENKMQESLTNVIAEGRGYKGFPVPYAPPRAIWLDDFNSFLDRIEAATKREIDALQAQIDDLRQQLLQHGNMAKMREALVKLRENLHVEKIDGCACGPTYIGPTVCASELIDAALSAPPRNCDVGTAKQQEKRYMEECLRSLDCHECKLAQGGCDCRFHWAQMPYNESEAPNGK